MKLRCIFIMFRARNLRKIAWQIHICFRFSLICRVIRISGASVAQPQCSDSGVARQLGRCEHKSMLAYSYSIWEGPPATMGTVVSSIHNTERRRLS